MYPFISGDRALGGDRTSRCPQLLPPLPFRFGAPRPRCFPLLGSQIRASKSLRCSAATRVSLGCNGSESRRATFVGSRRSRASCGHSASCASSIRPARPTRPARPARVRCFLILDQSCRRNLSQICPLSSDLTKAAPGARHFTWYTEAHQGGAQLRQERICPLHYELLLAHHSCLRNFPELGGR